MHNPTSRANNNLNIVKDLAQAPIVMSAIEVLQSFLKKHRELLYEIGGVDTSLWKPRLPHHLAFKILVQIFKQCIHRKILDEATLTCIMSSKCWKVIGSSILSPPRSQLKYFHGHTL